MKPLDSEDLKESVRSLYLVKLLAKILNHDVAFLPNLTEGVIASMPKLNEKLKRCHYWA